MNDDRPRRWLVRIDLILSRAVLQVEPLRQLEIELDRSALEGTTKGVSDFDIDLGTVKSTISGVQFPLPGILSVERLRELLEGMNISRAQMSKTCSIPLPLHSMWRCPRGNCLVW